MAARDHSATASSTLTIGLGVLACLVLGGAEVGQAQQPTKPQIDTAKSTAITPIIVTGKREHAVAPPVATVEVSTATVQRAPAGNPYDLIGRSVGIEVHQQGQGPGFASNVVIGGFTSDHSSDVLLVLDGVAINLPIHGHVEGYADWSILSPGAISTSRVIHGPASPLYGDFSLGGVVEVYTAADADATTGSLGVTSFGDVRGWVTGGFRQPDAGALFSVSGQREEGWRENADYLLGTAVLRGWRTAGKGRLEGGLYGYGSHWNSPGYVSVERYNEGDLVAATDTTDGGDADRYIGTLRYGVPLNSLTTLETQLWGQVGTSTVFLTLPEDGVLQQTAERDDRQAVGMQAQLSRVKGEGEFSVGLSGRADWTTYTLDQTDARVPVSAEQADDGRYQALGLYGRWRGMLSSRFMYDLGLRGDLVRYQSYNHLDSLADWQSATDPVVSPKLGASYMASSRLRLLGSLARGFRGPVGVIADPSRPLVTAWAGEIGAEYGTSTLLLTMSLFQFNTANERIKDPVSLEIVETGTSRRRGITGSASWQASRKLTVQAEGTFNDATITGVAEPVNVSFDLAPILPPRPSFHTEPLEPGDPVPGVSDYFGRVGAEFIPKNGLSTYALIRFTGPFTPIGEPGVMTQAYSVFDLGGSVALGATTSVDVDLLNVFDTKYADIRASGYINPGAPRSLLVSVRLAHPH